MRERLSLIALAAASASALLAGCAAGPDYRAPAAPVEPAFVMPAASAEPAAAFWRSFGDPVLDTLLADAVTANADVRLAQARLREARALAGEADAGRLPTLGLGAGAGRGNQIGFPIDNYTAVSASFNWELDFFGLFLTPVFYVVLRRLTEKRRAAAAHAKAVALLHGGDHA